MKKEILVEKIKKIFRNYNEVGVYEHKIYMKEGGKYINVVAYLNEECAGEFFYSNGTTYTMETPTMNIWNIFSHKKIKKKNKLFEIRSNEKINELNEHYKREIENKEKIKLEICGGDLCYNHYSEKLCFSTRFKIK